MSAQYIKTSEGLKACIDNICTLAPPFVCVDTEFERQTSYRAELALIQIASSASIFLIDPLSKEIDLTLLLPLFRHTGITKVFHSGAQDLEILWFLLKELPTPYIDTQSAAAFLGIGTHIGYEHLVQHFLQIHVDKSSQHTNWKRRPLTEKQQTYAEKDVYYLNKLYPLMIQALQKAERLEWVQDFCNETIVQKKFIQLPESAWKKVTTRFTSLYQLWILQDLCKWREETALSLNVIRKTLVTNAFLTRIAQQPDLSEKRLKNLCYKMNEIYVQQNFSTFAERLALSKETFHEKTLSTQQRKAELQKNINCIHAEKSVRTHSLHQTIRTIAQELNLPQHFLATTEEINDFILFPSETHFLLKKWCGKILEIHLRPFIQ